MEKTVHNCARNCWGELGCDKCEFFKPVTVANKEMVMAQILYNQWEEKRNTGKCKNYSQRCVVIGGDHHIENVISLFRYAFGHELKYYYKMPKIHRTTLRLFLFS